MPLIIVRMAFLVNVYFNLKIIINSILSISRSSLGYLSVVYVEGILWIIHDSWFYVRF